MTHITDMRSDLQGQRLKVLVLRRPFDACLPITRPRNVAEAPKLAGCVCHMPRVILYTSSNVKRPKVKVTGQLNTDRKSAIFSELEGLQVTTYRKRHRNVLSGTLTSTTGGYLHIYMQEAGNIVLAALQPVSNNRICSTGINRIPVHMTHYCNVS